MRLPEPTMVSMLTSRKPRHLAFVSKQLRGSRHIDWGNDCISTLHLYDRGPSPASLLLSTLSVIRRLSDSTHNDVGESEPHAENDRQVSVYGSGPAPSSEVEGEVNDILCEGPHQHPDHGVMGQEAGNNPAQTEEELEESLRLFLAGYEDDSAQGLITARAHAPATTPATMVAPTLTVSSSTASA